MKAILDPFSGFRNPEKGRNYLYPNDMANKTKQIPYGETKRTFSENVRTLMDRQYEASGNRPKALANDAGLSLSSIQRALSGETASNLDTVEAIASVFGLSSFELLKPGIGEVQNKSVNRDIESARSSLSDNAVFIGMGFDDLPQSEKISALLKQTSRYMEAPNDNTEKREAIIKIMRGL